MFAAFEPAETIQFTERSSASARQRLFGNIAPVYDKLNDALSLGQHRVWKRLAVQWSKAKRGDCLLDVCCGSGDLAHLLALEAGGTGKVTAVDFAPEMLDYARARHRSLSAASGPMARIEWLEGDALSLPCHNEQFDAATMGYGLRNVKSIPQALRELHRVVKPGGRVAILDFNRSNDVVSWIQGLALNNIVLPAADSYGLSSEYAYLQPSIQRFLTGAQQEEHALQAGFAQATHYEVGFALMGILVARKDSGRSQFFPQCT